METLRHQFAKNLRQHRRRSGLSQERLAEICELDRTTIGLLERRERTPGLDTVVKLARGLELPSPCVLLEGIA
jgi:DNA-binding XRE family transcriptional regulator